MSLVRRYLARPLARFGRLLWMSAAPLWPAGLASPRRHAAPRSAPRKPTRLTGMEPLERRETPNDLLGVLTSNVALGGVSLLSGQFVTPLHALFVGWGAQTVAAPARPLGGPSANRPAVGLDAPHYAASLAGLDLLSTRRTREDRDSTRHDPGAAATPPARTPDAGDDWLSSVGAFLESAPPRRLRGPVGIPAWFNSR